MFFKGIKFDINSVEKIHSQLQSLEKFLLEQTIKCQNFSSKLFLHNANMAIDYRANSQSFNLCAFVLWSSLISLIESIRHREMFKKYKKKFKLFYIVNLIGLNFFFILLKPFAVIQSSASSTRPSFSSIKLWFFFLSLTFDVWVNCALCLCRPPRWIHETLSNFFLLWFPPLLTAACLWFMDFDNEHFHHFFCNVES